jgi:hypothetical protein
MTLIIHKKKSLTFLIKKKSRTCLSDSHSSCESVLPLDFASKDVKNSSLLSDTLEEQDYMTETLSKM